MDKKVFLIIMRLFLINKTHTHYSPITPEWIKTKWEFFKNNCLKSIESQTNNNFKFIVLVDKNFKYYDLIQAEVEAEAKKGLFDLEYVNFQWGDGYPFSHAPFPRDISNFTHSYLRRKYRNCNWLITARLDGDDILAKDYVEEVWKVNRDKEGWITFINGYYFYENFFFYHDDHNNAHLVYVEPFDRDYKPKTVYHRMHNKIGYNKESPKFTTVDNPDKRLWADRIGEDTNIKKNLEYSSRMKRFVHRESVSVPIEDIKKRFVYE